MESRESFVEKFQGVIGEIGSKKLILDAASLDEYCDLTGHDRAAWRRHGQAPAGFLMTFTDPIISELFVKFFIKHPNILKGGIHTGSRIEFHAPIRTDAENFTETLTIEKVEEKSGSKGSYFAVDLRVSLFDEHNVEIFTDIHQFFLRT